MVREFLNGSQIAEERLRDTGPLLTVLTRAIRCIILDTSELAWASVIMVKGFR
jgi:hypothetical protein